MASYDAVVNLNVVGTSRLNRVASAVNELNSLTEDLNKNFNLLKPGAGELGDQLRLAFEPIKKFARDATNGVAQFANTLKGAAQQAQVFKTVLENVNIVQGGFSKQTADVKNLANAWVDASINASDYERRLRQLQETALANRGLMMLSSGEIAAGTEAGVGVQGPRLPDVFPSSLTGGGMFLPEGVPRLAAPGLRGLQGAVSRPGAADAIIGAGFPALFGGGPGAILGGGLGGLAGGAMGGPLGMALSIGLSAVGQKLDQIFGDAIRATQELGQALSRLDIEKLRESTIFVTAELDTQVRLLMEAGRFDEARAAAIKEAAVQSGALGSTTQDSANATNLLKNAWDNVLKPVQSILSSLATPFVAALAGILNIVGLIAKGINVVVSGVGQLLKGITEWLVKLVGGQAALDKVKQLTSAASEETERLRAASEAATDAGVRDVQLKKQLLDLERSRVEGSNRLAQQSQIDAAFTREQLTAEKELEDEIRRINREGAQLTEGQRALEIAIAEAKAAQRVDEAAITKEKAQQKLLNDALIASLRDQADAQQTQATQYAKAQSSVAQILQIELQRMQQRMQFVTSLNQEAALINQMAAKRKELAEVEYHTAVAAANSAVQQAAAEYDIVQAKYEQNNADIEQVNAAQRKLQTAIQARGLDVEIAGLKREQALETAEIERRQQQLNAYTEEYERINARTLRVLEEQANKLSNRATLLGAISQATQTINGIEIESLTRELERTASTQKRAEIIDQIYKLEVQNAKVVLEATRAQIQADLARANVAYKQVELEYQKYRAVVLQAEAQGIQNQAHYEALRAQESALRMAKDNLITAGEVAKHQWKAADAVFKAAVDAAELKKEMGGVAESAGQFAGSMERAATAVQGISGLGKGIQGTPVAAFGGAMGIKDPVLQKKALAIWEEATKFAEGKDVKVMEDIFQKARNDIARLIAQDVTKAAEDANKKPFTSEATKVLNEKRNELYESLLSPDAFKPEAVEPADFNEMAKDLYDRLLGPDVVKLPTQTNDIDDMRKDIYERVLGPDVFKPPILRAREQVAKAQESAANAPGGLTTPIPLTQPLATGLTMQPGGGAGTAVVDRMPTINLQTGPVLQQDDGNKYVSLGDLEKILQDFAAVVFNNARSTGGRRFQGVA